MATPDDARLCGRCGYDVRGLPTTVCPECGGDLREVGTRRSGGRREAAAWLVSALGLAGIVTIYGGTLVYGLMPERRVVRRLLVVDVTDGTGGAAAPGAFVVERETTRIRVPLTTRWWTARSVGRAWLRPAGRPGVRLAEYPPLTDAQRRALGPARPPDAATVAEAAAKFDPVLAHDGGRERIAALVGPIPASARLEPPGVWELPTVRAKTGGGGGFHGRPGGGGRRVDLVRRHTLSQDKLPGTAALSYGGVGLACAWVARRRWRAR